MGISTNQSNNNGGANSKCVPRSSSTTQSTSKPTYKKVGKNSIQKIKFYSKSCEDSSKQERVFHKLDPKNPQHAHKIQQRRKAIAKGKNTVGYDRYCRSVPKNKRQKRSMITPSTPDHTLDIPNKKWNGMVRSWYVPKLFYEIDCCDSTNGVYHADFCISKFISFCTRRLLLTSCEHEGALHYTNMTRWIYSSPLLRLKRQLWQNSKKMHRQLQPVRRIYS